MDTTVVPKPIYSSPRQALRYNIMTKDPGRNTNEYWNTILPAGPSAGPSRAHERTNEHERPNEQPEIPQAQAHDVIQALEGSYLHHDRIRAALGMPIKDVHYEVILRNYPDWPTNASPDASWTEVKKLIKESFEVFCEGVPQDEELLQWSLSPQNDRWSSQSPVLQKAIVNYILSALRARKYSAIADRLSRCHEDWVIKDLLDQRVRSERKKKREKIKAAARDTQQ
ncbi:hypothetical protein TWF481_003008 [Arthrobotrys musiformis]|uniref:Uncharacterized protein n=1 Tax=Arthrobotrys musiformis TaxID=47236 RepID=A0AAV9VTL6_9PEZI